MKLDNQETRKNMIGRLKRIEGQVRGVQSMLAEGRDCREVLQQLSAVRAAVQSAMQTYVEANINECLLEKIDQAGDDRARREQLAADLINLLEKAS